jgi:hypothetical protein
MLPIQHPYLPGRTARILPLSRFLPPLAEGMASEWLRQNVPTGSWILDPLGASPALALEAARAGYCVAVTTTNPVLCFMIEVLARSPQESELQAAIAALATVRRGSERLEVELKSLYETRCPVCGRTIQADGYLWERNAETPYACLYRCPVCREEGEHPLTDFDLEKLHDLGSHSLHYSRALERVNVGDPQARQGAEEALKACLPRQLYVISTLINKTASLNLSASTKQLLHALILSVCDQGNTLWTWPSARSRPRQLTTPPHFRENNLWTAFEEAVQEWQAQGPAIAFSRWPDLPETPGSICIFNGRPGALLAEAENITFQAVVSVLPRPAQAFWTFSALWSGWLWGPEAVLPMKSALERRRYDWSWYAEAIYRLFRQLRGLQEGTPFLSILPELVPGFFGATMVSTSMAGLHLQSLALNDADDVAQLVWQAAPQPGAAQKKSLKKTALAGMLEHLEERGEPARQMVMEAAGLAALAAQDCLIPGKDVPPASQFSKIQKTLQELLEDKNTFQQFEDPEKPHANRAWWPVARLGFQQPPLTDRVERLLLETLIQAPALDEARLNSDLFAQFPGLLTPPAEMVNTILASYAHPVSEAPLVWQLNEQERPETRRADLQATQQELLRLGKALGYHVEVSERSISWSDEGQQRYIYHCFASSIISRFVLSSPPLPEGCQGVLVFPGSRSRLLAYKLLNNPILSQAVTGKWVFLKFRHLRRFSQRETEERGRWQNYLEKDPPLWEEATQMRLLD